MKFKLSLITATVAFCSFKIQAQEFKPVDNDLIYQMTYGLKGVGSSAEWAAISLHDFDRIGENKSVILFKSHRDTTVYIGFTMDQNNKVSALSIIMPHSYLVTAITFLGDLKFKLLNTTHMPGFIECEGEENTIFWKQAYKPGTMMMIMKQKGAN
jgi:hypothetical protein